MRARIADSLTASNSQTNSPTTGNSPSADNTQQLEAEQYTQQLQKTLAEKREIESRLEQTRRELDSAGAVVRHLEQRVRDLIDRENQLNTELEQTKLDNETRLANQAAEMGSLRDLIGQLKNSEATLMRQMENTNRRCEEQLDRATEQNSRVSEFC